MQLQVPIEASTENIVWNTLWSKANEGGSEIVDPIIL